MNFITKKIGTLIAFVIGLVSISILFTNVTTVVNNSAGNQEIEFWISEEYLQDYTYEQLDKLMEDYVNSAKSVFSKNTKLKLFYNKSNPNRLVILKKMPKIFSNPTICRPTLNHKILVMYERVTNGPTSGGGRDTGSSINSADASNCIDGSIVIISASMQNLYLANDLTNSKTRRFQVEALVHEIGHTFGLARSEYYFLSHGRDQTNIKPNLALNTNTFIQLTDPQQKIAVSANMIAIYGNDNVYWPKRIEQLAFDPMLQGANLNEMKFSFHSANIINKAIEYQSLFPKNRQEANELNAARFNKLHDDLSYKDYANSVEGRRSYACEIGDFSTCFDPLDTTVSHNVKIKVVDSKNKPISNCKVTSFKMIAKNDIYEKVSGHTDKAGVVHLDLNDGLKEGWYDSYKKLLPESNQPISFKKKPIMMLKTSCDGFVPSGDMISYYDLQAYLYSGGGQIGDWHYNGEVLIPTYATLQEAQAAITPSCSYNIGGNVGSDKGNSCYFSEKFKYYLNTGFCQSANPKWDQISFPSVITSNGVQMKYLTVRGLCEDFQLTYKIKK